MKRPIIGIPSSISTDKRTYFIGDNYDYNNNNYSKSIVNALGVPIILPATKNLDVLNYQLNLCDGFLFPGGLDINPLYYSESPKPLQNKSNELMDWYQITLAKKAINLNKSILGICRGMQLLNVVCYGSLYQDVSYFKKNHIKHNQENYLGEKTHLITTINNSLVNSLLGNKYIVNSGHHQCINKLSNCFKATSYAPDGVIESIEMINKKFVIGVQWHPEILALKDLKMLNLFKKFINSCK